MFVIKFYVNDKEGMKRARRGLWVYGVDVTPVVVPDVFVQMYGW